MTAAPPPGQRPAAGPGRTSLRPGPAVLLAALLLLTACVQVKDEMPRVVPPVSGPSGVAAPVLPSASPAACTTTPPDVLTAAPAPGNRVDRAAADRAQRYLDAHPEEAGSLIVNESGLYAGFVSGWCRHREALRQLVGTGTRVDVFAVVQSYRAGQRIADRVLAAGDALRRAGVRVGTAAVDPRTGLTSVTTPDDPAQARAAILRELTLPASAPILVSAGDLPRPATG